jgi:ankyrin repeat protein
VLRKRKTQPYASTWNTFGRTVANRVWRGVNYSKFESSPVPDSVQDDSVVIALLAGSADPNAADIDGWTPLLRAARGNRASTAQLLLDKGANVNHKTVSNYTALMSAARWGCADVVPVPLNAGADFTIKGKDGRTALTWAKEAKTKAIADALMNAGARY